MMQTEINPKDPLTPTEKVALFSLCFWPVFFVYSVDVVVRWLK